LEYKCAENKIYFKRINPRNSSKTRSKCNNIKKSIDKFNITTKKYLCYECNLEIDRDYNSTLNLINFFYKEINGVETNL